ncbi:MAG TPA: hypothetical protein VHT27_10045 [Solirubrobacteraceae bacterium]|nr:hypothetical protein [Solirubrobacteraceae bacterium]
MSTPNHTVDQSLETAALDPAAVAADEPVLTFDLRFSEADALRAWLLKPAHDGSTSLDDPLVSRVLAELGRAVDAVRATWNVRSELSQAGLSVDHLSDDEVRELARRVADAALPGIRS